MNVSRLQPRRMNNKSLLLIATLASLLLLVGWTSQGQRVQYEYKFVQMKLDFKKTDIALTELGAQGWEAYAVNEENGIANFYLKRARP